MANGRYDEVLRALIRDHRIEDAVAAIERLIERHPSLPPIRDARQDPITKFVNVLGQLDADQKAALSRVATSKNWPTRVARVVQAAAAMGEHRIIEVVDRRGAFFMVLQVGKHEFEMVRYWPGEEIRRARVQWDPTRPGGNLRGRFTAGVSRLTGRAYRGVAGLLRAVARGSMYTVVVLGVVGTLMGMRGQGRPLVRDLGHIILRNQTGLLAAWVNKFFAVTGQSFFGHYAAIPIAWWLEKYIANMRSRDRQELALKILGSLRRKPTPKPQAVARPATPPSRPDPETTTPPEQVKPKPKPLAPPKPRKPAAFPDLTVSDLEDKIYMTRHHLKRLEAMLREARGWLRYYRAMVRRGRTDLRDEIKDFEEQVRRFQVYIDQAKQRIKTYREAQQDPLRAPGSRREHPPLHQPRRPKTPGVRERDRLIDSLQRLLGYRDKYQRQFDESEPWMETYRKGLRELIQSYEGEIEKTRRWLKELGLPVPPVVDFLKEEMPRDTAHDDLYGPKSWVIPDFPKTPQGASDSSYSWEDTGIMFHDDLYGVPSWARPKPERGETRWNTAHDDLYGPAPWVIPDFPRSPQGGADSHSWDKAGIMFHDDIYGRPFPEPGEMPWNTAHEEDWGEDTILVHDDFYAPPPPSRGGPPRRGPVPGISDPPTFQDPTILVHDDLYGLRSWVIPDLSPRTGPVPGLPDAGDSGAPTDRAQDENADPAAPTIPVSRREVELELLGMWGNLTAGLRRGVDVWRLAAEHGLDLGTPPTEKFPDLTDRELRQFHDLTLFVNDDLSSETAALAGRPGWGQLIDRFRGEPVEPGQDPAASEPGSLPGEPPC